MSAARVPEGAHPWQHLHAAQGHACQPAPRRSLANKLCRASSTLEQPHQVAPGSSTSPSQTQQSARQTGATAAPTWGPQPSAPSCRHTPAAPPARAADARAWLDVIAEVLVPVVHRLQGATGSRASGATLRGRWVGGPFRPCPAATGGPHAVPGKMEHGHHSCHLWATSSKRLQRECCRAWRRVHTLPASSPPCPALPMPRAVRPSHLSLQCFQ